MIDRSVSALLPNYNGRMQALDQIQLSFSASSLWVLNGVLALLMFGIALELSPADFARVVRKPKAAMVGIICQFLILPAATFLLIQILRPPPSVALGMILVAACPGGNVSNVIVYMSGGNSALSVGMTAISSSAATLFLPLNFAFWASLDSGASQLMAEVAISPWSILLPLVLLLGLPMVLGMWAGARFPTLAGKVRKPLRTVCGVIFLLFVALSFYKNAAVLGPEILPVLLLVVVHNASALSLGYAAGRMMRLSPRDCRTISIEVGIQNSGLAVGLIFAVFHGLGGMAMIAVLWGLWHIVAGSALAVFWSRRPLSVTETSELVMSAS